MTMETQKVIVIRVPPFLEETQKTKLDETVTLLEETFPDRKVLKIPAEVMVEFLN